MIRLLSLFSGIGAFESALRREGYQFETVNYCEIDPCASKAYSQIHDIPEGKNLHDVREVNPLLLDNINLVTYGFPCQDISVAGKQKGFEHEGERTRSGLFFEALRIIEFLQPEYAICENVKALTSKKFTAEFQTVLSGLSKAGYNNYWAVLNAKDYGIPQNRERVFIVSIRKDIDDGAFKFPEKIPLNIRVRDILETNVAENFYIDTVKTRELIKQFVENKINEIDVNPKILWCGSYNGHQSGNVIYERGICNCIDVAGHVEPQKVMIKKPSVNQIGNIVTTGNFKNPQRGRIYSPDGLAPALNTMQGGGREPKFIENKVEYRIRKLTPRECFRLMGFTDNDFDKIHGISNTQLYKMAGNSIVVDVVEGIFNNLLSR